MASRHHTREAEPEPVTTPARPWLRCVRPTTIRIGRRYKAGAVLSPSDWPTDATELARLRSEIEAGAWVPIAGE